VIEMNEENECVDHKATGVDRRLAKMKRCCIRHLWQPAVNANRLTDRPPRVSQLLTALVAVDEQLVRGRRRLKTGPCTVGVDTVNVEVDAVELLSHRQNGC